MEEFYTVEQISELLGMHPKTIQRYIREGKLRAGKIGKSWRVTGQDLRNFTESTGGYRKEEKVEKQDKVRVSSVVDIQVDDLEESTRIVNTLTAALNCKPREYGRSTMYVQHLEQEQKVRVTLWGDIRFMQEMINFISVVTGQQE